MIVGGGGSIYKAPTSDCFLTATTDYGSIMAERDQTWFSVEWPSCDMV